MTAGGILTSAEAVIQRLSRPDIWKHSGANVHEQQKLCGAAEGGGPPNPGLQQQWLSGEQVFCFLFKTE